MWYDEEVYWPYVNRNCPLGQYVAAIFGRSIADGRVGKFVGKKARLMRKENELND